MQKQKFEARLWHFENLRGSVVTVLQLASATHFAKKQDRRIYSVSDVISTLRSVFLVLSQKKPTDFILTLIFWQ